MPAAEALATLDAEGKVVFPCEVELADGSGTQVATATVHWHVRLNKPATAERMSLVRLDRDEAGLAVATFDSPPLNLFNRRLFDDLQADGRRGRGRSAPGAPLPRRGSRRLRAGSTCTSSTASRPSGRAGSGTS